MFSSRNRGDMKSNVSDYLKLVEHIYLDMTSLCSANVSDLRDLKTIRSRVRDEGISFLTITLPRFAQDLERALEQGMVSPNLFQNFAKRKALPCFLQGMLGNIFNLETGRLYDENSRIASCVESIRAIRQICLSFKKIQLPCTPKREYKALENFINTEIDLSVFTIQDDLAKEFSLVSSMLWDTTIHSLSLDSCKPRHGPGATAERISGNQKFNWRRWHERLEPYFPIIGSGYLVSEDENRMLQDVEFISPDKEQPVRVCLVPKTLKSPRIIAIEPVCMQYTQQGIRSLLYEAIELKGVQKGRVNFTDQSINQRLAMKASRTGRLATIDLSDASDRVPRDLALTMFNGNPDLRDAIDACRSTRATVGGLKTISLSKFASMGSALCFPVEAMYFYTICVVALFRSTSLPITYSNLKKLARMVYVYGDDIIIPVAYAESVLDYLQKYNCKVNNSKTFCSGRFRESCGIDAYAGHDVTPTYVRRTRPKNRRQATSIISWVSTANSFYQRGLWRTAQFMYNQIERLIGFLPYVSSESGALGRVSYLGYRSIGRWNPELHRFEVRAWVPRPIRRTDELDGHGALVKSLSKLEDLEKHPLANRKSDHLELSELHGVATIKRTWVPVT